MAWHVDLSSLHVSCDRVLTSVFTYNGRIYFCNGNYFHTVSLHCVLPNTSSAVQCNHWRSAAFMDFDAHKASEWSMLWPLSHGKTRWDFKGYSTEENIFHVLKEMWEDLQNNSSTVLKLLSCYFVSIFQRMELLILFQVEIRKRFHSESSLKLVEVNGKTLLLFFFNFSRVCIPAQVAFSLCSGSICVFAALCLLMLVHLPS